MGGQIRQPDQVEPGIGNSLFVRGVLRCGEIMGDALAAKVREFAIDEARTYTAGEGNGHQFSGGSRFTLGSLKR